MSAILTNARPGFASFLNAPVHTDLATLQAHFAILGAPYGTPYIMQNLTMHERMPAALRQASAKFGYGRFIDHWDYDLNGPLLDGKDISIVDCGDVRADPFDILSNAERIREATAAILDAHSLPIVLGGDDSITIPLFEAYEGRGKFTVVQIDAHLD